MSEELVLTVERVGARGDGIATYEGERIYLPLTAPGDVVHARLGEKRGDGRAGSVVAFEAKGPRAEPPCRHFGLCGGCSLQHLTPEIYAATKSGFLLAALHQHGLDDSVMRPLRQLPPGARRRARFTLHREGRVAVGFQARASHRVVDLAECPVLHPSLAALIAPLRRLAATLLKPRERGAATVTLAETGIDVLLDLPAVPALAALEAMAEFAGAAGLARLAWRTDGAVPTLTARLRPAEARFAGVAVDLPYDGFLQASAGADRVLADEVTAALDAPTHVADLFCGVGTLSFALARHAPVHAIDGDAASIAALARAAARAGLDGRVTAERRDLDHRPLSPAELQRFDTVVFDPPRAGAWPQAKALAASTVRRVIAVSCNPATFARDTRTLVDGGYRLLSVQPIDGFIWSPHLELVAALARP